MAVLSREEIRDLNFRMLGKGAPVEYDGIGYNKVDFSNMGFLSEKDNLTVKDLLKVLKALNRYKNTQLCEYADSIKESIEFYTKEDKPKIHVIGKNHEGLVQLAWDYDSKIYKLMKTEKVNRSNFRWTRNDEGNWILNVKPSYLEEFGKTLEEDGNADIQEIREFSKNCCCEKKEAKILPIEVSRSSSDFDKISVKFPFYNKKVVSAAKNLGGKWNNADKSWEIFIETAKKFYDAIPASVFDKSSLKFWADLVSSWGKGDIQLKDLSCFNLPFKPYDFQLEDAKKLLKMEAGLNGNEVGCGKTFEQVIIGESIPMKKLVICPATLRLNWKKEILSVNPEADVQIVYSDKVFQIGKDWTIIGYPSLMKFLDELKKELFQVIMFDEAHFIQAVSNYGKPSSKRAEAVLELCSTSRFVFPISGTPKTNRNKNLFNILRAIRHPLTRIPYAFSDYGKTYCDGKKTDFGWDFEGNSNDEELHEEFAPYMVRHLKKDVLPHLKKQRQAIEIQINLNNYFKYIDKYLSMKDDSKKKAEALVALTKAKQSAAIHKAKESVEFAKMKMEAGEKVVIVTCFTDVVKAVESGIHGCKKIVGGMSDTEKNEAIEAFQNGDAQAIVLNIAAGGVGITLTASHTMVINDIPWTTGELEQAEGRIWRGGQTETAMIYYMVAEGCPMDNILMETITAKSATINSVVDGGAGEEIDFRALLEEKLK